MSTLRVNNLQNTSTTDGGISIDNSGHVTIDGQVLPSAGPLSNRNLIINGAMQVAQRGTSSTTNGYGSVDRFDNLYAFGSVTQSQESLASGDPYTEGFRNYLRLTNTSVGTNDAAESRTIRHYIEAQNMAGSGWNYTSSSSYLTISFWARSSVSGTYYTLVRSHDGTTQAYTFSYTLTADTWTKVSHSIPGATSVAFDNDNNKGLDIRFLVDYGTNNTDSGHTLNTWSAWDSTSQSPDFTHDWTGTADATFDLTGVQLEVGSVATPFEHRSYGDELLRCQRYYQVRMGIGVVVGHNNGTAVRTALPLIPEMRALPGVNLSKALKISYVGVGEYTQSSANVALTGSGSPSNNQGVVLEFGNFSGLTSQRPYVAPWDNTKLLISAEL